MAQAKCPVCDWKIETPVQVEVRGRSIAVCCDDCAKKVKAEPAKYAK